MSNGETNSYHDVVVRIWGRLIFWGRRTLDEIPAEYRDEVKIWCEKNKSYYI